MGPRRIRQCAELLDRRTGGRRLERVRRSRPRTSAAVAHTDARVLEAIWEGDESGLRATVAKYGGFVYGKALQILRHPVVAEEVTQDIFVMLWRKAGSLNPRRGSLKAFLRPSIYPALRA